MKNKIAFALILIIIVMTFSCTVKIANLKENPKKYIEKEVAIKGVVTNKFTIPLTKLSFYELYDKTDTLFILTTNDVVKNQKRLVKGELIAYVGERAEESMEIMISQISKFLIENDLVEKKKARKFSKTIAEFFVKIIPNSNKAFMLIEKEYE